jgi:hypothetical protein
MEVANHIKGKKGKKVTKNMKLVTFVLHDHCPSLTIAISKFA